MTKRILSVLLLMALILVGCANSTDSAIPTQLSVPTSAPTTVPTQTAIPTDVPLPTPTELIIPQTDALNPNDQAFVRAINASPDLGVVDVYIEALAIATNLRYSDFTEREGIVAGQYNLRILPTGSFLTDPPLYEQELTITGEQSLIFIISGTDTEITVTTLPEPNAPLADETSRLLMINAVDSAVSLAMVVDGVAQTTVTPYLQVSETTEYDTGRTDFAFQNAGENLFEFPLDLRNRQNYTFVLLGTLDRPDTLRYIVLNSIAPGLTEINFINASPDVGLVDVYFGNDPLILDAEYGEIHIPQTYLSGTYDIQIYPLGANPEEVEPLAGTQFIANPDEDVTLIMMGSASNLRFATYRNDDQPTYDNQARITFINSVETAPNIILSATDESLNQRLGYGRVSETYDISSEQGISFSWIQQLDNVQDVALENFNDFTPVAGQNYLYIFTARGFDAPILFPIDVGTLGFEYEEIVATSVPTSDPTRIRIVNLWQGEQFVVRMDGTVIAEGVEYSKATNNLIINSGEHTIIFYDPVTDNEIIEISNDFLPASDYSIVVYQDELGDGNILLINDTDAIISSATGGIRLTVLDANPDSLFGIGYSEATPNISQPSADEDYRRSLSLGIQQVVRQVPPGVTSDAERIPIGDYNIRIIDNTEASITFTHTEITIDGGVLYNVFLTENERTGQTHTIIVPYSP